MSAKVNKTIAIFMVMKDYPEPMNDWNFIMMVVGKIENIIGHTVDISLPMTISWWYSPKKKTTYEAGSDGYKWSDPRTPFDAIGGKFYNLSVYEKGTKLKLKKDEIANSKKEAVVLACYRWIVWYNKTVNLKKRKQ